MAKSPAQKILAKHPNLIHSDSVKVVSHVQRQQDDWWINSLMLEDYDVAFKYKRKKQYKSLKGALVNITYYPSTEEVAGMPFEYMKVVRVKRS